MRQSPLKKHTALFLCGPTAVGKTAVAIALARHLNTEIISFDSRQFYSELKIGSAPPNAAELNRVTHHFIGHLSIVEGDREWNAGSFATAALEKMTSVFKTKAQVLLVGGSGLYMRALSDGFDSLPEVPLAIRQSLNQELADHGLEKLVAELHEKDPLYAEEADLQNPQRVIRALEIIRGSGKAFSTLRNKQKVDRPFNILKLGLTLPREELYARINTRVDRMIEAGLEKEAKDLYAYRNANALQTVGYKEWWPYFEGQYDLTTVIEEIKKNSRRYAKRQMTWLRRESDLHWFSPEDTEGMMHYINQQLEFTA